MIWERMYAAPLADPSAGPQFMPTRIVYCDQLDVLLRQYLEVTMAEYTARDGTIRDDGMTNNLRMCPVVMGDAITIGGTTLTFGTAPHVLCDNGRCKPCFGVHIVHDNVGIYFTGDTTYSHEVIIHYTQCCRLILHDCTFSKKYRGTVHSHYGMYHVSTDDV